MGYDQHTSLNLPYTDVIPNLLLQMKADGKSNYSINFTRKALTLIQKHAPLTQPEAVKAFIATINASDGYKKNLCTAYNQYCKFTQMVWNNLGSTPFWNRPDKPTIQHL